MLFHLTDLHLFSLSATYLRNRIIGALRDSSDSAVKSAAVHVPQEFIFDNPILEKLSTAVVALIHNDGSGVAASSTNVAAAIDAMIAKYTSDLPTPQHRAEATGAGGVVILLTGSTGALGSHILANLLLDDRVTKVYTLNRAGAQSVQQRQKSAFEERGLDVTLLGSGKLVGVDADLAKKDLGLTTEILKEVRNIIYPRTCSFILSALR